MYYIFYFFVGFSYSICRLTNPDSDIYPETYLNIILWLYHFIARPWQNAPSWIVHSFLLEISILFITVLAFLNTIRHYWKWNTNLITQCLLNLLNTRQFKLVWHTKVDVPWEMVQKWYFGHNFAKTCPIREKNILNSGD